MSSEYRYFLALRYVEREDLYLLALAVRRIRGAIDDFRV